MRRFAVALSLAFALAACGGDNGAAPSPTAAPSATPSLAPEGTSTPVDGPFVRILSPTEGAAVDTPLFIEGEARTFDGRLVVSVRTSAGVEVCAAPLVADRAAPEVGRWSVHIGLRPPPQPGGLVVQAFAAASAGGELALMDEVGVTLETGDPAILVTSPRCGETVGTTVTVDGTASVFEGTVNLTARGLDGEALAESFTTATQGAPGRGPFSGTLELPPGTSGPVLIEAWSASAEDGTPEHVFGVPVFVNP
ncbi:MAG TPA: Gmad2 immunoglobulin-like domain-containing protein [Dehalococcoidia bacterium]|nr:Gmad2 immunoglobulin-like domain-containing protein [Dehalococcoidia bacterium]